MFRKVLVGVDEHRLGLDAIALARALCAADGDITLVHVYIFPGDPRVWRGYISENEAADSEHAGQLLQAASKEADIDAELRSAGSTSVGRGLHELAELLGADLVVVGSSHRGLLGRVFIGDNARAALDGAPCAIALAPAGFAETPVAIRNIAVGYDGSPESEQALATARALAAGLEANLAALEVVSVPTSVYRGSTAFDGTAIAALVDEARERISAVGSVQADAAYGDPAQELALWAASFDLLVVGSRGYGPVGRLVHGSTSRTLVRIARCPLLVVPRSVLHVAGSATDSPQRHGTAGE